LNHKIEWRTIRTELNDFQMLVEVRAVGWKLKFYKRILQIFPY
jgi:hypothetical protein